MYFSIVLLTTISLLGKVIVQMPGILKGVTQNYKKNNCVIDKNPLNIQQLFTIQALHFHYKNVRCRFIPWESTTFPLPGTVKLEIKTV